MSNQAQLGMYRSVFNAQFKASEAERFLQDISLILRQMHQLQSVFELIECSSPTVGAFTFALAYEKLEDSKTSPEASQTPSAVAPLSPTYLHRAYRI